MKRHLIIALSFIFILSSCSLNSDSDTENDNQEVILYTWHLIKTEGGLAGVNQQFELDTVIWTFDELNGILKIENNNDDDTKQDLLDSGTYNFSISTVGENFIFIDSIEYGQITVETNTFTIDENNKSTGQGADGFLYTFQRVAKAQ
mgnify:CR=1 FL=1|tara:strand:+ start:429 stop:869 length:441 start_codon:yes stop_codon:yes gene_type:complete